MIFRSIRTTWMPFFSTLCLAFLTTGYHPGMEDDGVYLSAIKSRLHPELYPHPDAVFFKLQMQASLFDDLMAWIVRLTGISLVWVELLVQIFSIGLILWASLQIARRVFDHAGEQWGAVTLTAAMLTLPVSGTMLFIADQHLHPRNPATGLILMAVLSVIDCRPWRALPFLAAATLLHPLMGAMGISFTFFVALSFRPSFTPQRAATLNCLVALPILWLFAPSSPTWESALQSRVELHLYQWTWYEWLGALAPPFLFWLLQCMSQKQGEIRLALLARAILFYSLFHQLLAMLMLCPAAPERLIPLQPMRYLQLVYLFMTLLAGGLIGRYLLKRSLWRWILYLLIANGSMFAAQRASFASVAHLELPGCVSSNPWQQAFVWIRENTPKDAFFAVDPNYMKAPDEDYYSFRALAERSQLADAVKDTSVVAQIPNLSSIWHSQLQAEAGFEHFQLNDFERLKTQFGVNWTLVRYPQPSGLDCRWHNPVLAVCRIP